MTVVFHDGWPFRHPSLLVEGLDEGHVNADGEVCLWRVGACSGEWLTLRSYTKRIAEWARRVREDFQPEDFALDAHLYFGKVRPSVIATVKLKELKIETARGEKSVLSRPHGIRITRYSRSFLALRVGLKDVGMRLEKSKHPPGAR